MILYPCDLSVSFVGYISVAYVPCAAILGCASLAIYCFDKTTKVENPSPFSFDHRGSTDVGDSSHTASFSLRAPPRSEELGSFSVQTLAFSFFFRESSGTVGMGRWVAVEIGYAYHPFCSAAKF